MSLSVIPLTILGQITGVSGSGETALYQVSFKSIDGTPLYGVAAVWTDEQAEIEALAAQKPYGVWINPISGTFTVKFAGYTYVGSADLTDDNVLTGVTPIEFMTTEVSDRLLPEVNSEDAGKTVVVDEDGKWEVIDNKIILPAFPEEITTQLTSSLTSNMSAVISANGSACYIPEAAYLTRQNAADVDAFDEYIESAIMACKKLSVPAYNNGLSLLMTRWLSNQSSYDYYAFSYEYIMNVPNATYHFLIRLDITIQTYTTEANNDIHVSATATYLPALS